MRLSITKYSVSFPKLKPKTPTKSTSPVNGNNISVTNAGHTSVVIVNPNTKAMNNPNSFMPSGVIAPNGGKFQKTIMIPKNTIK